MWGQKSKWTEIELKKKELGEIPSETCPDIDKVIASMEELRKANAKLREIGKEWYDYANTLAGEYDELQDDKEKVDDELAEALGKIKILEEQ